MAEQLTSLDLIPMVRKALGNPATGDVPDLSIAQYIWLAECRIASMYEYSEVRGDEDVATEAGTAEYQLVEPDILKFQSPANNVTSNIPMKRKDDEWYANIGRLITGQGTPFFFFESGEGADGRKQVTVSPTPDGVYTLNFRFIKIPTMPDHLEQSVSDLPQAAMLQVVSEAAEVGLQLIHERAEAGQQAQLTAKTTYAARHAIPGAAQHKHHMETFQRLLNRKKNRSRRG